MPPRLPHGLGIFARGRLIAGPWRHVIVNAWDRNAVALVSQARAAGAELVLLFGMPGKFTPATWRAGVTFIRGKVRTTGADGYVVDVETGWANSGASGRAQATALGAELAADAASMSVGITGFPFLSVLAELATAAGANVFAILQIYGRQAQDAASFRQWFERWHRYFGARLCLAVAGWASSAPLQTPAGFAAYLQALPSAPSHTLWTEGGLPAYIAQALSAAFGVTIPAAGPGRRSVRRAGVAAGGALAVLGVLGIVAAWAATR